MLARQAQFCPILVLAGLFVTGLAVAGQADDDWAPIPPDELALKDDPLNPGAPAIILYRETVINHRKGFESHHYRIKILSDRGAEYGNVELPYTKEVNNVHDIKARTVQPDGTVVPFRGRVVEKAVAKTRDVRVLMKIFTLPQVEVGSIVEYKYRRSLNRAVPRERVAPNEIWMIQDDLSLLRGRFTANPLPRRYFGLIARNFPEGHAPKLRKDGSYLLEIENVPAFRAEDFMPPAKVAKANVRLIYLFVRPEDFWKHTGSRHSELYNLFVAKPKPGFPIWLL